MAKANSLKVPDGTFLMNILRLWNDILLMMPSINSPYTTEKCLVMITKHFFIYITIYMNNTIIPKKAKLYAEKSPT